MIKTLDAHYLSHLDIGGYKTNWYAVKLPPAMAYEDLFRASFWKHHQTRLNPMDIVRVRAEDGSFDVMLTVAGKADNGELTMEIWPSFPKHMSAEKIAATNQARVESDALKPTKVPLSKADGMPMVRIEYLEATKWRLRGFDGQEVSRNHPNETEARKAMAEYMKRMGFEMPSDEEIAAGIAEAKAALEAARAKTTGKKDKAA